MLLEDGTKKIFLNMTSKNGTPELVSLLQYMKYTTLDNHDVISRDKRILDLDSIVKEVKQSEEWEAVQMNILEIGIEKGREEGLNTGIQALIETSAEFGSSELETIGRLMEKMHLSQENAEKYMKKYWH